MQLVGRPRDQSPLGHMVGDIRAQDKAGDTVDDPAPSAPHTADPADPPPTGEGQSRISRVSAWIHAHPLVVVAIGAGMIALGQALWIWTHRHLGAYDPDESGYIAAAMRMHRSLDPLRPWNFVTTVGGTGNGIVTPLLSVPVLVLGPRDPRTAMLAQPLLMAVASVAVAGITRRLAGAYAAIAAGLLFAVLPTTQLATQSYWYGLSAATCMAVAMWALVTSDRGDNWRIWLFGVAVGLMFLSRTMTLGYAPAVAVAGLVVAGWDRRRLLRMAGAGLVAIAIAGPWYFHNRGPIFEYLFSYGYGERAGRFGSGNVVDRAGLRIDRLEEAFSISRWWYGATTARVLIISMLLSVAWIIWRRWSSRCFGKAPRLTDDLRSTLAVAAAFVVGMAALVSTSNQGVWFEYPLVVLAVPVVVAVIASGPRWVATGTAVVIAAISVQLLAQLWWLVPFEAPAPTSHYEYGFAQYDERFGPDRRDEHAVAADEWWEAVVAVRDAMREQAPGRGQAVFTVSGNMQLFNANSLSLSGEMISWPVYMTIPDTAAGAEERAASLTPTAFFEAWVERILVVARHDQILFTPDTEVEAFAEEADDAGWRVVERVDLPDGGVVEILRLPDG